MSGTRTSSGGAGIPAEPLQIEMVDLGSTVVVKASGMAAVEVVGQLSRALQEAAGKKPALLALDITGLSFISSTGLGGIVAAHVTCQKNNIAMALINPKPFIREILNLTKLSSLFNIYDSVADAEQQLHVG